MGLIFLEDMKVLLFWLIAAVVAVNLLFLCSVLYRRLARRRYFVAKDAAAERYGPLVAQALGGTLTLEQAAERLSAARTRAERAAVEQELWARQPEAPAPVSHLLFTLGYVERWARIAFGFFYGRKVMARGLRGEQPPPSPGWHAHLPSLRALKIFAVPRALAVGRLGRLEGRLAQVFMAEALRDPAPEVRQIAVALMGRRRDPRAIPLLLEEMRKALEQSSDISLRTAKSALAAYQIEDLGHFLPLVTHDNPRLRFFVVDTIREICNQASERGSLNKDDFPRRLYEALLQCVEDESEDVRARAAGVIRYFRDRPAQEALRRLLRDPSEFVRLHAVRAAADPFYHALRPDLAQRLQDMRWRVREAAARSLVAGGGKSELYRQFIASSDRYASEQMADEIQRVGAVDGLVSALAAGGEEAALAQAVARQLAATGKTALLTAAAISSGVPAQARAALLDALMAHPDDELVAVLQFLAQNEGGALRQKALALLRRSSGPPVAAFATLSAEKDSAD